MTKEEVKLLCEHDEKLRWWAMVLFAELSELAVSYTNKECGDETFASITLRKIEEFPHLVIHNQIQRAKDAAAAANE